MPLLSNPRIDVFFIVRPFGNSEPTVAIGTNILSETFCAPHTIGIGLLSPISMLHIESLSASGCFLFDIILPTTTPGISPPTLFIETTSVPESVSIFATSSIDLSSKSIYSLSQLYGIFIFTKPLLFYFIQQSS